MSKFFVFILISASVLSSFIFFGNLGYFSSNQLASIISRSPEINIAESSPAGDSGGLIIPASCPSFEHFPGECSPPPPPSTVICTNTQYYGCGSCTTCDEIVERYGSCRGGISRIINACSGAQSSCPACGSPPPPPGPPPPGPPPPPSSLLDVNLGIRVSGSSDAFNSNNNQTLTAPVTIDLQGKINNLSSGRPEIGFFCNHNDSHTSFSTDIDYFARYSNTQIYHNFGPALASSADGDVFNVISGGSYVVQIIGSSKVMRIMNGCTYSTAGTYYPKVIVRGSSNNAFSLITLTILAPPLGNFSLNLGGSVACNSVPLSWTASSGAQAYRILKGSPRVDISPYQPYTALNFTDNSVSQNTSYIYQIEAYNNGGTNRSNPLNVNTPFCPPTLNFSANPTSIFQGQSSTLMWNTTYTTSCVASSAPNQSDWSGSKSINGSQVIVPLPPPSVTYNLQCSGPGGSSPLRSATINITSLALPEFREIIPR